MAEGLPPPPRPFAFCFKSGFIAWTLCSSWVTRR